MTHTVSRHPRPHPILKRDSSPFKSPVLPFCSSNRGPLFSPHVHFPPTPRIAATYPAHSPTTYDRKPIVVSPCVVQLPRRGERELSSPPVDADCEPRGRSRSRERKRNRDRDNGHVKGSYFHPRAYEACKPEVPNTPSPAFEHPAMPPLIQDLSPSDESDDSITTPPGAAPHSSASSASMPSDLTSRMSLHLPHVQKARLNPAPSGVSFAEFSDSDSPPLASLPPPPRPTHRHRRRPELMREERHVNGKGGTGVFSPDLDEGCLGGF